MQHSIKSGLVQGRVFGSIELEFDIKILLKRAGLEQPICINKVRRMLIRKGYIERRYQSNEDNGLPSLYVVKKTFTSNTIKHFINGKNNGQ